MGAGGSGGGVGPASGGKGGNATAESPGTIADNTADAKLGTIVKVADETDSFGMAAESVGIDGSATGMDPISGRDTNSGAMKKSGWKFVVLMTSASSTYASSLLPKKA